MKVYYGASYEPLVCADAAWDEDVVPSRHPDETDVWCTEWQVAEDGVNVERDEHVDWDLVPMDQDWVARLFAGRRAIPVQLDTYADAGRNPSELTARTRVAGRVARIDQVSVRYHASTDSAVRGMVPETGGALQYSVLSFRERRAHRGKVVGWVVRVRS